MNRRNGGAALFWSSADKVLTNGMALVISIILARLIEPSEYGVIATASIFTVLLSLFVEPGMTSALIQKKQIDDLDYSTILSLNLVIGLCLYILLFCLSDAISEWFGLPVLSAVLKVLGLQIIIGGINSVQIAFVHRNMLFKRYFLCSFTSVLIGAVVGIIMAYYGAGVWALVAYNMLKHIVNTIMTFLLFKCRFGLKFSKTRFKEMFPFAGKMLFTKFIDQGYVEATQTIICKVYSSTELAFYNKGKSFPDLIINNLNSALQSVMFPLFSRMQDDGDEMLESMRNSIRMTSYICIPMMVGLLACAENFILVILTDQWLNSVPFLQLCCIYSIWVPFSNLIRQSLKAKGEGGIVLKLESMKTIVSIILLVVFLSLIKSPIAIALSVTVSYTVSFFVEWFVAAKYLNYSVKNIIGDFVPSFVASCFMGLVVFMLGNLNISAILELVVQVICGVGLYVAVSYLFKFPQFEQLLQMIKNIMNKKTNK